LLPTEEETMIERKSEDLNIIKPEIKRVKAREIKTTAKDKEGVKRIKIKNKGIL